MTVTQYALRFPQRQADAIDQDVECVEVELDGEWETIRFHDYEDIFALPGLYEQLFSEVLECDSPREVVAELVTSLGESGNPVLLLGHSFGGLVVRGAVLAGELAWSCPRSGPSARDS